MPDALYRGFDAATLEAKYDNRGHVPECNDIIEGWARRSAVYRDKATCRLDVAYGPTALEANDLFLPVQPNGTIHAFIHGGYWRGLDKGDFSYLCAPLVASGAVTASVNYALCPAVSLETIVEQTRQSLAWLYRNAAEYGADPDQLHISGHSAGAHLAVMMLATHWPDVGADLPEDLVKSVTAISGVYDLEPILHISTNEDIRLTADMADRMSPMNLSPAHDAPLSVFVGDSELEEFVRQSKDFAADWSTKLSTVDYTELPGLNHFSIVDGMAAADDPITARMIAHMA